jgi:CO/xanthine dehydrogenase FAD-binding subunit
VKPPPFDYHAPRSLDDALDVLASYGGEARVLAGGQSLVPLLNLRVVRPAALVDLARVAGLRGIAAGAGTVRIGAMTRQVELERTPEVSVGCPLVAEAAALVGSPAIRSRGTLGGNLAHADPASELPAVMVALDARLTVCRRFGQRTVPAADFFRGFYTTALEPDEVVTAVEVPVTPPGAGWAFEEVSRTRGDFALVGAAVVVTARDDGVASARVVLAGVGPVPVRCEAAEHALLDGREPAADAADAARDAVEPEADLHASAAYRKDLVRAVVGRAARRALARISREAA